MTRKTFYLAVILVVAILLGINNLFSIKYDEFSLASVMQNVVGTDTNNDPIDWSSEEMGDTWNDAELNPALNEYNMPSNSSSSSGSPASPNSYDNYGISNPSSNPTTPTIPSNSLNTPINYGSFDVYPPVTSAGAFIASTGLKYDFVNFNQFAPIAAPGNVAVVLTCADGTSTQSGCSEILYCQDVANTCTPSITYQGNIIISTLGTSYIRYFSKDRNNNIEGVKSNAVLIKANNAPLSTARNSGSSPSTAVNSPSKLDIPSDFQFSNPIQLNQTSPDAYYMQIILNSDSKTQIATEGQGSPGQETIRFGNLTRAAVMRFQALYANEILTPIGLTEPTGIIGFNTLRQLNKVLETLRNK